MGLTKPGYIFWGAVLLALSQPVTAQKANALVRSGNRLYRDKKLDQSIEQYQKALKLDADNPTASYNLGNTQFRKNNYDEAVKSYESGFTHSEDKSLRENSLYNKGVALQKQNKLSESIDAWKGALKLNPEDEDARENLEKALQELKKQQPPQQQKNDKQDQQKKQDDQQKKDKQDQPKQPQSKLSKQQVQQLMKALQEKEKEVQDKMNQNKAQSLTQPEKDW